MTVVWKTVKRTLQEQKLNNATLIWFLSRGKSNEEECNTL